MLLIIKQSGKYEVRFNLYPKQLIVQIPSEVVLQPWESDQQQFGEPRSPITSHTYARAAWSRYDLTPTEECASVEYRTPAHNPYFLTVIHTHQILGVKIDGNEFTIQLPRSPSIRQKIRDIFNNL